MRLDADLLDGVPFTAAQLDRLYAAIQDNDKIGYDGALPATIRLDYDRAQLIDGFRLSRQLWREGFDRDALIGMTRVLGAGGDFGAEDQARFRHVRAKFKHLRFAFVLYAADHRCPVMFKAVTTAMGHLQDAVRTGQDGAVRRHAGITRLLLARLPRGVLEREADRLVPCDTAGYRRFVLAQIAALRGTLALATINGHQFHAARKIVSRQVSFHDDMRTLFPDPDADPHADHVAMARYLGAINGLMGRFHDDLVLRRGQGERDYARGGLVLPADIRRRLTALVALYS